MKKALSLILMLIMVACMMSMSALVSSAADTCSDHAYDRGVCVHCGASKLDSNWLVPEFAQGDYSMVVLPDTQNMVQYWPEAYYKQMQWIADHQETLNIQAVLHMGDMVNTNNDTQWTVCKNGTDILDEAGIPWMPMRGNHDDSAWFNRYYDYATYGAAQSWFGGSYQENKLDYTYWFVTVGEREYLILSLGWAPSWDVLSWAQGVVETYADKSVILTCHAYMNKDGSLLAQGDSLSASTYISGYPSGEDVWDAFKKYENVVLAMGGHVYSENVVTFVDQNGIGRDVTSLLFDRQNDDTANHLGTVAVLTFHEDSDTVDINWYSTCYDALYREKNQFSISVPHICDHSFITSTVAPTCLIGGGTKYTCKLCGYAYVDEKSEALGHDYHTVNVAPTCTEPGYITEICSACGHTERVAFATDITNQFHWNEGYVISAVNGNMMADRNWVASDYVDVSKYISIEIVTGDTVNADTTLGIAFYDASKKYISGIVHTDKTGSEYGILVHDLTIPENAVYVRTTWYSINHDKYDGANIHTFYCKGYTTEIPPVGHDYVATVIQPTCTEPGYCMNQCNRCDDVFYVSVTDDLTEQFIWTQQQMIISTTGKMTAYTDWCASDFVDISGYQKIRILTANTANVETSTGLAFYDSNKNYVSGVKHTDGSGVYGVLEHVLDIPQNAAYVRSTWYADGNTNYKAEWGGFFCVAEKIVYTPALGHNFQSTTTAPTCTTQGFTTHTCACGESYVDSYTPAEKHSFSEWETVREATFTQDGEQMRYCTKCSHVEMQALPLTVVTSGNLGYGTTPTDKIIYTLYSNGTMVLEGEGAIFSCYWDGRTQPFIEYRKQIKHLIIGEGITQTSSGCFAHLTNLETVSFPSTMTKLPYNAFMNAFAESVTELTIPSSVTQLGTCTFGHCGGDPSAYFTDVIIENPNIVITDSKAVFNGGAKLDSLTLYSYGIDNNVSAYAEKYGIRYIDLYDYFHGTHGEASYTLTSGVLILSTEGENVKIPADAPWNEYRDSITKIIIEDGITDIADGAFRDFHSLTAVTMHDKIKSIGSGAFAVSATCRTALTMTFPRRLMHLGENIFAGRENVDLTVYVGSIAENLDEAGVRLTYKKQFKFLMIGNSYTQDASGCHLTPTSQLFDILQAMLGEDAEITLGAIISGGKGINWHATQAELNSRTYSFSVITSLTGKWKSQGSISSADALAWADWDAVSLQAYNPNAATGQESIPYPEQTDPKFYALETASEYMLDHIAKYAPQADAYFYMHWSQTKSITLNAALSAYNKISGYLPIVLEYAGEQSGKQFKTIVPVGLSVQNARSTYLALLAYNTDATLNLTTDTQIGLQRDYGHLSFNIGRYIAGLTFAEMIIPEEMRVEGYVLPDIRVTESVGRLPKEYTEIAQKSVHAAVASWKSGKLGEVTEIVGYTEDPAVTAAKQLSESAVALCKVTEQAIREKLTATLAADVVIENIELTGENACIVTVRFGYTTMTAEVKLEMTDHTYQSTVTAPTCTEQGYTTHTCVCGHSYVDSYVASKGHSYVNGICTICEGSAAADPTYTHAIPESQGVVNAIERAYQLTDVEWTPVADMPGVRKINGEYTVITFEAGVTYRGIPYSGVTATDTYVGLNVSLESYLTALKNAKSVLYTENLFSTNPKSATYFGTVCSKFAQYVLDIPGSYNTNNVANIPGVDTVALPGKYTVNDIKLGDIVLHTQNHTSVCTDILYDADGNVAFVEISEAVLPLVRRMLWSPEEFYEHFTGYRLCRYQYLADVPSAPDQLDDDQEYALMPRFGDKYNYKVSSTKGVVDILESGYTTAVVIRDGEVINRIAINENTKTFSFDCTVPGHIEMYLEKADGVRSGSVYANVVKSSVRVDDSKQFAAGKLTVTIDGSSGTPVYVQVGSAHAIFCNVEGQSGTVEITFPASKISTRQVRVAYQNEYGIYLSNWISFTADENPSSDPLLSQGKYWNGYNLTPSSHVPVIQENKVGYWTYTMIPVVGGETYYSNAATRMWFLDADGNPISTYNAYKDSEIKYTFTVPQNAAYVSIAYSPSIEQGTETIEIIHTYTVHVTPPTCTAQGYTTHTCVCGESYVDSYVAAKGHNYRNGVCTICQSAHPNLLNYKGKVISVLGDSISTFAGYIPTADGFNLEHLPRYPQDNLLTDVNETWWMQVISALGAKLGINDSWRGATVSGAAPVTSGTTGENAAMANLVRIQNLGSNGTPDVILFYGGTNDLAHVSKVGSFDADKAPTEVDLTTAKWDNLADGYVHTLLRLKHFYPDAQIICLLPTYTTSYYSNTKLAQANEVLAAICTHYGVPYVDLRQCGITTANLPDGIHPDAAGMDYISEAALASLLDNCMSEAGENVVYTVTHHLSGAKSSLGYYKGISAGKPFDTMITGEDLTVSVMMGGVDITDIAYANGTITIAQATGDIVITAAGRVKTVYEDYLQDLPENICGKTNLWAVLEHHAEYYTVNGWGIHTSGKVYSVTFRVNVGDRIFATSCGAAENNGGGLNGIRVTWFDQNGVLKSMSAEETYAEMSSNGYLTAPANAVAVNIPMWNNSDDNEIFILNREHTYQAVITPPTCTTQGFTTHTCVCGHSYVDSYVAAKGHTFGAWTQVKAPTCGAEGQDMRACAVCGAENYRDTRISGDANQILVSNPLPSDYFAGKKLLTIGDSITSGVGLSNPSQEYYGKLVADALGMTAINKGSSGSGYCSGGAMATNKTLTQANVKNADVITIMLGINDWDWAVKEGYWNGKPGYYDEDQTYYQLGDFESTDTSTFYGALHQWCQEIARLQQLEGFEDKQFIVITPLITSWNVSMGSAKNWDQSKLNVHGHTLRQYCTAIMEVCTAYGIPVFDANMFSGIYYNSPEDNNVDETGGDGVHINANGHALLAEALIEFLLENYAYEQRTVSDGGHSYDAVVTDPTCTEQGYTTHSCSACVYSYVDAYVAAKGHTYKNGICTACGEKDPTYIAYGDLDDNGVINTTDVVLLRRHIAGGYGVEISEKAADLNSDGILNTTDVVLLRRYIAGGYDVVLPGAV